MKGSDDRDDAEDEDEDNETREQLDNILDSITKRMIKSELEDFELVGIALTHGCLKISLYRSIYQLYILYHYM